VAEGGKFQAPCLRIGDPDHPPQWLYESSAIIHYLQQRFSEDNL
jgi:glutathione S-transferase